MFGNYDEVPPKVAINEAIELARAFGVQAVPTYVVVHKGTERDRLSGGMSEEDFALWVASRT